MLTDGETEACALLVPILVLFELAEVEEEILQPFFRDPDACVLDPHLEVDVHVDVLLHLSSFACSD